MTPRCRCCGAMLTLIANAGALVWSCPRVDDGRHRAVPTCTAASSAWPAWADQRAVHRS